MREWTDIDYAQAAIDMLPDTVEEMRRFLTVNRVRNTGYGNPVGHWVRRWTDTDVIVAGNHMVYLPEGNVLYPPAVEKFIQSRR